MGLCIQRTRNSSIAVYRPAWIGTQEQGVLRKAKSSLKAMKPSISCDPNSAGACGEWTKVAVWLQEQWGRIRSILRPLKCLFCPVLVPWIMGSSVMYYRSTVNSSSPRMRIDLPKVHYSVVQEQLWLVRRTLEGVGIRAGAGARVCIRVPA